MLFSDDQKMRLRIAAAFLRKRGHKFENGNFYDAIYGVLCQLEENEKVEMRELIDWVVSYETEEQGLAPAQAQKQKQKPFNKEKAGGASRRLP